MPPDPNNPFAPDDPRWWWQQGVAQPPAGFPSAPPTGPLGDALAPINDWSATAPLIPLMPSARSVAPAAFGSGPQPSPASDPFTAYWSQVPADSLRAFAWMPPIFPDALGRVQVGSPLSAPPASAPVPTGGLFGTLPQTLSEMDRGPGGIFGNMAWRLAAQPRSNSATGGPFDRASQVNANSQSEFDTQSNADGYSIGKSSYSSFVPPGSLPFTSLPAPIPSATNPQFAGPSSLPLVQRTGLALTGVVPSAPQPNPQSATALDWRPLDSLGRQAGYPPAWLDPPGWPRIQLAADRENIDPNEIFDPLAPLRVDLYNSARFNLRQIQPNNYKLNTASLRPLGSAPTMEEIAEFLYEHRVAQSTQPLADMPRKLQDWLIRLRRHIEQWLCSERLVGFMWLEAETWR